MSAFMCSREHLAALAAYAVRGRIFGSEHKDSLANMLDAFEMLRVTNVESLRARYRNCPESEIEPSCAEDEARELFRKAEARIRVAPAVNVISSANCYRYQACEHDGWAGSHADSLTRSIIDRAIQSIPGYREAPWGAP